MLRAMLVDDEKLSVRMLESIIDWNHYGVTIAATADNGMDALRLFSELRPEIVITDIRMPFMDGLALMRRIKEFAPETEFILVSAYADFEYAREAIRLGGANYLLKPVDEFELEKAIKKITEKIDTQRAAQRMIERTNRRRDLLSLYAYMRSGSRKNAAQSCADRLGISLSQYALMSVVLNESSMNAHIENSLQIENQLPYLHTQLEERMQKWCSSLLFEYLDGMWCAIVFGDPSSLAECARDVAASFRDDLSMEVTVCFTAAGTGLDELPEAFRTLQQLNQYCSFMGDEAVLGYGYNCQSQEFNQIALADAQKTMEAAIRQKDGRKAQQIFSEALDNLHPGDPSMLFFVYDFCYAAVRAVRENLPSNSEDSWRNLIQSTHFRSLQRYTTLDELRSFMEEVFSGLGGGEQTELAFSQLVQDGIGYLQKNYDKNISLEEICEFLGVSRNYFCYLFKKETKQNLWTYLTDIRLRQAQELLRTTQEKTYAIAYQVGYDNPSYFAKLFKKNTGMTPNEYRKSCEEEGIF